MNDYMENKNSVFTLIDYELPDRWTNYQPPVAIDYLRDYRNKAEQMENHQMNYPRLLERPPERDINTLRINCDINKHNCSDIYEHFSNCPLCSSVIGSNTKVYIIIIIFLIITIISLCFKK